MLSTARAPKTCSRRARGRPAEARASCPLGPRAQAVLKPFLDRDPEAFLFSPKESEAWRLEHRPAHFKTERKTKVYPCEPRARA